MPTTPRFFFALIALTCGALSTRSFAADPTPLELPKAAQILADFRPGHPRLIAPADRFDELREAIKSDATLTRWFESLRSDGEGILRAGPSQYEIPDGLRLLATSRRVLDRVTTLALLYRIDGDGRWVERAWRELEAAAKFPDWNPRHFLDTAEMTAAFALGYDWLHDQWTADQRQVLHTAIVELGLKPGLKAYQGSGWWHKSQHNWNQVCNGGLTLGALALADLEPQLAGEILENAIRSVPLAMQHFAPDGAWGEGPGYWSYATQYNVAMLAALESALGTDYGLSAIPGFSEAGTFPMYLTGPLDRTFNFADAGAGTPRPPQLFWLARKFNRPEYAAFEIAHAKPDALDLVFYDPRGHQFDLSKLPLEKVFRDAEVGVFRSVWNDRNALWVAFKAGSNAVNHSNLDLGTLVLEALGERWFVDLGADNYNLPGYFGRQRWDYYRLRAEGHNTLVINPGSGPDQDPKAATKIVRFEAVGGQPSATLDLTPAYAAQATKVQRTISLIDRRSVTIRDELETKSSADIWSLLHTPAEIALNANGREATLHIGRQSLLVELVLPADAQLEILPAAPLPTSPQPDRQAVNKGVRKLGVHLTGVSKATIELRLKPVWP
jgi:hypothetical protein